MKRIVILGIICVIILYGDVDWIKVTGSSDSPVLPTKLLMKSDSAGILIRVLITGFCQEDTTVDNKDFKRLSLPDEQVDWDTSHTGKPQLPYVRLLIAVPDSCDFTIKTNDNNLCSFFTDYLVYPVPEIVFETDTFGCVGPVENYVYDASFYQTDTFFPGEMYTINTDGYWRDQRVLDVDLYPLQYNPYLELMYVYTVIDLHITYQGDLYVNENGLGPFEQIGREVLLNYPGIDKEPESVPTPCVHYYTNLTASNLNADYIIVTHEDFLSNEAESLQIHALAEWRVKHNQFHVAVVKMCDIIDQFTPGPAHRSLKTFLQHAYENWGAGTCDGHFAYCLFIGDWDYVPTHLEPYYHNGAEWLAANEGYFRDLSDPVDTYDDIMLGRFPVKATASNDLEYIITKTINYEENPNNDTNWRRRGVLIAGDGGDSYVDASKTLFSDIGYDTSVIYLSQLGTDFDDSIHTNIQNGAVLVPFFGHGNVAKWSGGYRNAHIDTLSNDNKLPVVLSYACLTAMFQADHENSGTPFDTCLGECFLFSGDSGAVAFFGVTSIISWSFAGYGKRCLQRILRHQHWILGEMLFGLPGRWYTYNTSCLLGDPALDLGDYTAFPGYPDLVVRPQAIDIIPLHPFPYTPSGDNVVINAKVLNIGNTTAYNVDVEMKIVSPEQADIFVDALTISEIQPRDSANVTFTWNTALTHQGYYGEIGDCDFVIRADPANNITESWEYNNAASAVKKVVLYPYDQYWPITVSGFTQPALANLDDEGSVEIVYASCDSIYVFDNEGNVVTNWPQYFAAVRNIVLGDIDNDENIEIVAVSTTTVTVYDYQGNIVTGWPQQIPFSEHSICGYPALGDIDGDGMKDIVLLAIDRGGQDIHHVLVYENDGGQPIFDFSIYKRQLLSTGISISNVRADAYNEIVLPYQYINTEIADSSGTYICNSTGIVDSLEYGSHSIIPALVDINNDQIADVILGCSDGALRLYDAAQQNTIWTTQTNGGINTSPAVGDINTQFGFDGEEIAFGNDADELWAVRGINASFWFPWPREFSNPINTSPALANLDRTDGVDFIISIGNEVWAFTYAGDTIVPFPLHVFQIHSSVVIGDIDGDRYSENVLSSADGYLHVWQNSNNRIPPYTLDWSQFHHDYQRTGLHNWVENTHGGNANPKSFSTGTTLSFTLNDQTNTKIKIYDAEGNKVKTLVDQTLPAGTYNPVWYGKNDNFVLLPNGVYFIEIKVKNQTKIIPVEINR